MERTIDYVAGKMRQFLRRNDPVLICFDAEEPGSIGYIFREAALRCEAKVTVWGTDRRWKTLLRQAFRCRAGAIFAPPLVILGLTKLARASGTPLYIRNVLTAGYACPDWMIDGIRGGLDCGTWGCFDCNHGLLVAGFSCGADRGVHLRDADFEAIILDGDCHALPPRHRGKLALRCREDGSMIVTHDLALIDDRPCSCGCSAPLLMELGPAADSDMELLKLLDDICRWTSVLDCAVGRGVAGLEIEIVAFPGEKLPKLPSCAKLTIRPFDPEADAPFENNIRMDNGHAH